jgi:hypothetical protein
MKGFLVQLQLHPKATITLRTVVEDGAFWLQVGRKLFRTTPEETAQILGTPGFEAMTSDERCTVILDVVNALSTLEMADAATAPSPTSEERGVSPKKPRTKKEGSFLEIVLSPIHYTYARKLRGSPAYAFYDILTTVPLQRTDLASFSQRSILLDAGLLLTPAWPSIGWLPLTADRSWISYSWTARALAVPIVESKRGVRNPETEFFLVTEWFNPIDNVAYSKQTRAKREELNGLQRWGLTTPEVVEEKLRLHYGLTPTGEQMAPLLLSQQPPW